MPMYLWQSTYTADGIRGVVQEGGTARRQAVEEVLESVGGRLVEMYYAFGVTDTYCIVDLPDNASAAAAALAISALGAIRVNTIVLLTPEEIDEAVQKSIDYRPPGG